MASSQWLGVSSIGLGSIGPRLHEVVFVVVRECVRTSMMMMKCMSVKMSPFFL